MKDGRIYVGSATEKNTIHRRIHRAFSDDKHAVKGAGYKQKDVQELDWIEMEGLSAADIHAAEQGLIDYYGGIRGGKLINKINAPKP